MFVPIYDVNPLKSIRFQYVNIALILANIVVFALSATGLPHAVVASFGVVPTELFNAGLFGDAIPGAVGGGVAVPEPFTLITYMFFHGDALHLVSNMLFLWVFGDNVEDAMGHVQYLVFYLLCGVAAALFHAFMMAAAPEARIPLIGASGAVAGVIAAYLMLHPRVRVWVLAFRFFPLRITAALALGLWILLQVVMVFVPQAGPIAWWAHIGGLLAGAILILFMRRPGVPLFDRATPA